MSAETETTVTPGYHAALAAVAKLGLEGLAPQQEGEFTSIELAQVLGISEGTVARKLQRLINSGQIQRRKGSRPVGGTAYFYRIGEM